MYRECGRVAARYTDRRSRPELSGAAPRMAFRFPCRPGHPGGAAGRHEWLQEPAASLDERLDSDLPQAAAQSLARGAAAAAQARSHSSSHLELRLSAPLLSLSPDASVHRRNDQLVAHGARRYSDLPL